MLSRGDITAPMNIEAHRFSRAAVEKIQKAGGKASELLVEVLTETAEVVEEAPEG